MPEEIRGTQRGVGVVPYFSISAFILVLDRFTKCLVIANLSAGESIPIIKGILHITFVLNKGIIFGLFQKSTSISIVIAFFVIAAILVFFVRFSQNKIFSVKLAASLILAGSIGNLIDRLRLGAVIDFLDFRIWPVFNVADSAISIGACLLFFRIIINKMNTDINVHQKSLDKHR